METLPHVAPPEHSTSERNGAGRPAAPRKSSRSRLLPGVLTALTAAGVLAWYFLGHAHPGASGEAAAAPPPPTIGVQTVIRQKQRLWNDFSGRLHAVDSAEIRPEVNGRIVEVRFHDGQSVKAGDILFVIDPRPFEATASRAEARIALAKANLQFALSDQARNTSLLKAKTIAQREFDRADSANNAAAAELKSAEADLKTAQVDLDHAFVKAPIDGRVSRAELTVGNLVQSGPGAPLLTSIVSENGIYADFEVDEQTYLESIHDGAVGNEREKTIPVELASRGEAGRTFHGFIQNFDNRINPASGTIRARAKFENPDQALVPGMFVKVRLASSQEHDLLSVADRAVGFDQSKKFVFVVSPENKVIYREVELGASLGGRRVVLKGVETGDRVVVDGTQRVRPDAIVNPQEIPLTAPLEVASIQGTKLP
jgi:multidrug efflux system membrane fusion protein